MKILEIYNSVVGENSEPQAVRDFYERFIATNSNPDFLTNNFRNPNFELRMVSEGSVKKYNYYGSKANKCETNVFNFIKEMTENGVYHYYPVSGWAFLPSTTYFEHFWVYDDVKDLFLEITPVGDDVVAYGGVVNKNINDDIQAAQNFYDIDFLKGKAGSSLYSKHINDEPNPKLDSYKTKFASHDEAVFSYIKRAPEFAELAQHLENGYSFDSISDLRREIPRIERAMETVRNNNQWMALSKIVRQIHIAQRL